MSETPKVEERKVQIKRKNHPSDWKYPSRHNTEHLNAKLRYLASLSKEERELARKGLLVKEEQRTEQFLSEILPGDEVGVETDKYIVVEKLEDGIRTNNKYTKVPQDFSKAEIDFALNFGFADILRRDGKLYGVTETEEVTLKVVDYTKTKE